ncbi:MAG: cytochrome-c oxidase, cbb3-type subunit III [Betaproteobacteria bacterium]|nr:cytochrome-c oxidase, cbb3-type subunit III [Betaproteobacteria bacterium]
MSDFVSGFWSIYITVIVLVSVIGCGVLLWSQDHARSTPGMTMGHVWDETLEEYNNPLPNWWRWMFYITVAFSLAYLALYPGLGSYAGQLNWSSRGQYDKEIADANASYDPIFDGYLKQDLIAVAADPKAREMGRSLFLTYCAQCHGSDAKGAKGFPNLTDKDWLWGGEPGQIETTILDGRSGVMPPYGGNPDAVGGETGAREIASYVRSLSGLTYDSIKASQGKERFATVCAACHGLDGKGNQALGAPNLTDKTWLYGSSEATIVETITKGRSNSMPGHRDFLGAAKVHLLAAYVVGLGGSVQPATPPAAAVTVSPGNK